MRKAVLQKLSRLNPTVPYQKNIDTKKDDSSQACLIGINAPLSNSKLKAINAYSKMQQVNTNTQTLKRVV